MTDNEKSLLEDFKYIAFAANAQLILKQLKDKRLTSKRYVSDFRWLRPEDGVTLWFNIPYNTKRSIPLEKWAEECERTGLRWELRQDDKNHYTVFLMMKDSWIYDKQIRSFESMRNEQ